MNYKEILIKNDFRFKKNLGQNFISDKNLLSSIVELSGIDENSVVMEIGTGAGALTAELARVAKKVHTFEVDVALQPILHETLAEFDNIEVHFADILKLSDSEITQIMEQPFFVVANLPYYITSPVIMRLLEGDLQLQTVTTMVQKEVADRLTARPNTPEYGSITLSVALRGDCEKLKTVDKKMFFPVPKVDSTVIQIKPVENRCEKELIPLVRKLIKACFLMRRKTLVNNLSTSFGLPREKGEALLKELNFDTRIRGEILSLDEVLAMARHLRKYIS